jgi:molybdopterin converting factor small subunit
VVTVRLFAAARAAAGTPEVTLAAGPVANLVAELEAGLPAGFGQVLAISSLVCDGTRLDPSAATPIPAGAVIDVLPPFAGG